MSSLFVQFQEKGGYPQALVCAKLPKIAQPKGCDYRTLPHKRKCLQRQMGKGGQKFGLV